jgi:preprotein translocase subunit SecF
MEFFKIRRTIPFMRHALIFNVISLLTFLAAVFFLIHKGLNFSIEFTGGTVLEVQYSEPADVDRLRATLAKGGYQDSSVQNFGSSRDVIVRLPTRKGERSADIGLNAMYVLASPEFQGQVENKSSDSQTLVEVTYRKPRDAAAIRQALDPFGYTGLQVQGSGEHYVITAPPQGLDENRVPKIVGERVAKTLVVADYDGKLRRQEYVGPQVGSELVDLGLVALLVTAVGIVLYLWLRFEWRFGLSGIVANLHDVVIILGFFAFFQWEFSLPVLAAVLAVLGYSVNESVVVFDRVRENFRKMRKASTQEVIDSAITGVISRTIITHLCTQMMVTTMLLFGGQALHYFALALTIGILFGIYSSVLVASPLVMWLGAKREQFVKPGRKAGHRDEHEGAVV